MWWTLAYINIEESCLELWRDEGREVFEFDHWRDYNPTKSIEFAKVKDLDHIKAAVEQGKIIECDVDDKDIVVVWREEK